MPDVNERVFNDDLLLNQGDVEHARKLFPAIGDALDWPRLRRVFTPHEREANQSKRRSRQRGVWALVMALFALWLAALEPVLHELGKAAVLALTGSIAVLGAIGVVLGSGVLMGARKERWLRHRAATERLRQLHFQILVRRATQLAAADPTIVASAMAERERVLDLLERDLKPGVARPVETIIQDVGGAGCWLVGELPSVPPPAIRPAVLKELFEAYATLRFQHQEDYANKKLARGVGLWPWEPAGQAQRIEVAAYSLTLIVVLFHILAVIVVTFVAASGLTGLFLGMAAIWAALAVLALRVLEDGLRPRAEVGRLRLYRGEVEELFRKFKTATEPAAKLALMERLEELSYRELRDFLALHDEASFVL